jgi:hypothetical protein
VITKGSHGAALLPVATPIPAHHFVALDWMILPTPFDLAICLSDYAIVLRFPAGALTDAK